MSKRRRLDDTEFSAMFRGLEKALHLLDEVLKNGEVKKAGEVKDLLGIKGSSMVYSYSIRTLTNDKIEESTLKRYSTIRGLSEESGKEPLIDIFDSKDNLTLIIDLPGFKEEDIKLKPMGNKLIISINNLTYKEISLPTIIKADKINTRYRNGILEARLEKCK
ncbi:MAG: Hsp20/alpha crystallin family protein [archaeon]|nr:Hsp20/alpha crystallin family protein [archaeon]MCP8313027.1 Hsp20/alpha crystallin family protein [archaeon]